MTAARDLAKLAPLPTELNGQYVWTAGGWQAISADNLAGFAEAKAKLDGISAGAQVNVATNLAQGTRTSTGLPLTSSTGTGTTLPVATTSLAGLQSAADKAKLDGIAAGAQVNAVTSVAGRTGAVALTNADVGLGSVDDTADTAKPVSTAQQAALDGKVDKVSGKGLSTNDLTAALLNKLNGIAAGATANDTDAQLRDRSSHTGTQAIGTVDGLQGQLDAKAPASALAAKQDLSTVIAKTATAQTSLLADAGQYLRFTNASASTYTVAPQSAVAWPDNAEITIRRAAAGNLTLTPGSGVTLNAPSGGTLVLTNNMTVTLKRVATNVWDVIGQTVAA